MSADGSIPSDIELGMSFLEVNGTTIAWKRGSSSKTRVQALARAKLGGESLCGLSGKVGTRQGTRYSSCTEICRDKTSDHVPFD